MKTRLIFLALTVFFISWFSFITPTERFADPDAFYHITIAKLILEQGPITNFPWLDLTTLGTHYADQHFLFHTLQIPFLKLFSPLDASRISSIFFAVICMLSVTLIFFKLKLQHWWLWPILLAFTQPFCTRLIQGKASPLAILFWFVGVGTLLYVYRVGKVSNISSTLIMGTTALLFTLTHGGWILLPVSLLLIILGDMIYQRFFLSKTARYKILDTRYSIPLVSSLIGCTLGILVHPNREALFSFLKVQLFDVAIATPQVLRLGTEWNTSNIESIISMFGIFGIIILLVSLGHILSNSKSQIANRKSDDNKIQHLIITLIPLLVLLFGASIKSLRFTEYFQPLLVLFTALLVTTVNWKNFYNLLKLQDTKYKILDTIIPSIIALSLLMVLVQHIVSAYSSMHYAKRFFHDQYQTPIQAIAEVANPGDRVYHSMWDEFPILFYHNQDLRYVSGLDPTFLYKTSSTLALDYQNLVFNASSTQADAYSLIHDHLQAKFILIDHERWPNLAELIASDHRYTFLTKGNGGVAYKVEE
jgi:hypothetical protein